MNYLVILFSLLMTPVFASDFTGRFIGPGIQLELSGEPLSGTLIFQGQSYPVTATENGEVLSGSFQAGDNSYAFTATLQGELLTLVSGGNSYSLQRETSNPLAQESGQSDNPLITADSSPILAQGQYANLSQDNALAFIEALEFSLIQVGYNYTFTETDYQQLVQALTQAFPQADQQDQAVLSQARDIWTRVSANWSSVSEDDRKEFVLGVFILAFGEETVEQWVAQNDTQNNTQNSNQELGSGGSCGSYEECTSRYMGGETWTDSYNSQGCWAAAGCSSYDSSSNTFNYDD
jgi:hypothetical protein